MSGPVPDLSARGPLYFGMAMLALLVFGFGWWSFGATLSGAIIAPGQIEIDQNRQVVQHPDGGVVAAIHVKEGDRVAAGDVLISLDPTLLATDLSIVEGQLHEAMARRARLAAERDGAEAPVFDAELLAIAALDPAVAELVEGQRSLFAASRATRAQERAQLARRQTQIASQIDGIEAQRVSVERQLDLIEEELAAQQSLLDRGLAQAPRVLALQREEASLSGRIGELVAAAAEFDGRRTEIDLEILKLDSQVRESAISMLRDLQVTEAELRQQRNALRERLARLDIRAPASGIVYGLTVFAERAVIRPAEPLLFVIPQDRPLVVASRVQPINGDEVWPGQDVRLRIAALDARSTPELQGRVLAISADLFTDERTGNAYYRAEIELPPEERARLGEVTLLPGMPVEAFIRTRDRRPVDYLLEPLTRYLSRAMREG